MNTREGENTPNEISKENLEEIAQRVIEKGYVIEIGEQAFSLVVVSTAVLRVVDRVLQLVTNGASTEELSEILKNNPAAQGALNQVASAVDQVGNAVMTDTEVSDGLKFFSGILEKGKTVH
ncbi:MAG TPA: hypothetical protein VI957_01995 [Candidatus Paceibacterota bacterium]